MMYGKDNYGASGNPYAQFQGQEMGPSKPLMGPPQLTTRTRINLIGVLVSLFVPWFVFLAMFALWSFQLRYSAPGKVLTITIILGTILGLFCLYRVQLSCRALWGNYDLVERGRFSVWSLFIAITAIVAFALGLSTGSFNYSEHMRGIYDVQSLNAYVEVNPATMRGQELMDAGRVQFVSGANVDLNLADGFKNTDVYCVAPITLNGASLASYDFWAVGKNCCSDKLADFRCGAYKSQGLKGGVRITDDVDRDFYRLAVQQAQSAHAIKAIHPLFFEWTENSFDQMMEDERAGYQVFLMSMLGHFIFQAILVAIAVTCFTKNRFE
ncbi:Pentatricopeptide repeat-containing protein [Durusdinium trenchii]|uniref:Chloroplastic n=1 Tax=Durusdinium trenchii TaxID=1381693 RepID=A0ABP0L8F8_9DINO